MINSSTGEIKFDDYDLIVHPELSLSQFQNAGLSISDSYSSGEDGWTRYSFKSCLDGLVGDFMVFFRRGKIHMLDCQPLAGAKGEDWCDVSSVEQQRLLDDWLVKTMRGPGPYEYAWGEISSSRDIKTGEYSIVVLYQRELVERAERNKRAIHH